MMQEWEQEFRRMLKEESVEMRSGTNVLYRLRKLDGVSKNMDQDSLKIYVSNQQEFDPMVVASPYRESGAGQLQYTRWAEKVAKGTISFSTSKLNAFTLHKVSVGASGIIFTFNYNSLKTFGSFEAFNWDKVTGSSYGDEMELRLVPKDSSKSNLILQPANRFIVHVEVYGFSAFDIHSNMELNRVAGWCVQNNIPMTIYDKMYSCLFGVARFRDKTRKTLITALTKGVFYNISNQLQVVSENGREIEQGSLEQLKFFRDFPEMLNQDELKKNINILTEMRDQFRENVLQPITNELSAIVDIANRAEKLTEANMTISEQEFEVMKSISSRFSSSQEPKFQELPPNDGYYKFQSKAIQLVGREVLPDQIFHLVAANTSPFSKDEKTSTITKMMSLHGQLYHFSAALRSFITTQQNYPTLVLARNLMDISMQITKEMVSCAEYMQDIRGFLYSALRQYRNKSDNVAVEIIHQKKTELLGLDMFQGPTLMFLEELLEMNSKDFEENTAKLLILVYQESKKQPTQQG